MNVYLDIETIPRQPEKETKIEIAKNVTAPANMKKQETIDAWHNGEGKYAGEKESVIDEAYRKTALDALRGEICSIAWAIGDGEIEHCGNYDGKQEADLLRFFFDNVLIGMKVGIHPEKPYFIGHNIAGFDLKFIWQRAVILGVKPSFELPFGGRHRANYFCTMQEWAGFNKFVKMDNLAKAFGIEGKGDMDGSKVWDTWKEGDYAKVCEYNVDDVRMTREVYKRMTFK